MEQDVDDKLLKDREKTKIQHRMNERIKKVLAKNNNVELRCKYAKKSVLTFLMIRLYHNSILNSQPKEIIKMIAEYIWSTRKDEIWFECYKKIVHQEVMLYICRGFELKNIPKNRPRENITIRDKCQLRGRRNRKRLHKLKDKVLSEYNSP